MKKQTIPMLLAVLAVFPLLALAQSETPPHQHGTEGQPGEQAAKMEHCEAMMARHREMQERMAAMDAELDRLVAAMRSASGEAKAEATAAVVEELVEQRKSMRTMMMQHHQGMMQHMMGHMGAGEGMGMMECPMMQHMKPDSGTDGASGHPGHVPG